jgi:hypothetical protein
MNNKLKMAARVLLDLISGTCLILAYNRLSRAYERTLVRILLQSIPWDTRCMWVTPACSHLRELPYFLPR